MPEIVMIDAILSRSVSTSLVHDWPRSRVRFGFGARETIKEEAELLGVRRLLLISNSSTRREAGAIAQTCAERTVGCFSEASMHVPLSVVTRAADRAGETSADGLVCVGGGSATGLAKGVAKLTGLPIIAVPTTYSGSEMTSIWGHTQNSRKITGRDDIVRPRIVIYDPALTISLPVDVTVTSAMNAVAHSVEALWADRVSPITALIASHSISELFSALAVLVAAPKDKLARSKAMYGAWLAGWTLNDIPAMGLHHKLCHILGGTFHLPHSALHTVVLPHVVALNARFAPAAVDAIRAALTDAGHPADRHSVVGALWEFNRALGAPVSLREIGLAPSDLPRAIASVLDQIGRSRPLRPCDPTNGQLARLVTAACHGDPPGSG